MNFQDLLQQEFLSNTLENYFWFIGFIVFGMIFKQVISKYLSHIIYKIINRDKTINISTFDELLIKPIGFFILLMFIYLGSLNISLPELLNIENSQFSLKLVVKLTPAGVATLKTWSCVKILWMLAWGISK